ncbi:MAG: hypothetical protein QM520_04905 [Gammaproteobacteria bacterium]|nr:hypothetical protein [Gammaproteobacteria bacterium]
MDAWEITRHDHSQFQPGFARALQEDASKNPKFKPKLKSGVPTYPSQEHYKQVKDAIYDRKLPSDQASEQLLTLLGDYCRYTQHSGNDYFFVRTLCHCGHLLLK